ncbi:hypothetical protein [Lentzea atacamensis]|uniref:hypothetical protein n=1 Tax=Lentzea atacamensis TaxID=531938 RepID=UPI0011BDAC22|nr:hypothetical protein [Lentzea atacamensis]
MKPTSQIAAAVRTLPSSHPAPDARAASCGGRARHGRAERLHRAGNARQRLGNLAQAPGCRPAAVERLLRGRAVTGYITD